MYEVGVRRGVWIRHLLVYRVGSGKSTLDYESGRRLRYDHDKTTEATKTGYGRSASRHSSTKPTVFQLPDFRGRSSLLAYRWSLVRTGPAKFEVGEQKLAPLVRWPGDAPRLCVRGRSGRVREPVPRQQGLSRGRAGGIEYSEFATDPCRSMFKRVQTMFSPKITDNCNVNVTRLGERLRSTDRNTNADRFRPRHPQGSGVALTTRPASTRPLTRTGPATTASWSGTQSASVRARSTTSSANATAKGAAADRQAAGGAAPPGYIHSFGLTEHYIVLAEFPLVANPISIPLSGRPFIENFKWEPELAEHASS